MKSLQPNLIVMCGIQGSGKTTFTTQLLNNNTILYSYDLIASQQRTPYLRQWIFEDMQKSLLQQKNVVYDNMNLSIIERKRILTYFNNINCNKILYIMDTPLDKCLDRHHKRAAGRPCLPDRFIFSSARRYEKPSLEEGWDEIIYIKYQEEGESYGD